jgi:hypothetical protein
LSTCRTSIADVTAAERATRTEFVSRLQDRIEGHAEITKNAQIAP